jgi:hypothetical protein
MLLSLITLTTNYTHYVQNEWTQIFNKEIHEILFKEGIYNSCLLKTCKSSIPSPTPIYFTGILN